MPRFILVLYLLETISMVLAQDEGVDWDLINYSYIKNNLKVPASPNASAFTKYGEFNVSQYTGTANVGLGLFQLGDEFINMQVSLNYSTGGVKTDDFGGWVGLGWNVSAGGAITRTAVGNPDITDNYFGVQSNWPNQPGSYSNEISERKFLDSIARGQIEAQPDIYSFNAGNISGRFIIKKDKSVVFESQDYIVMHTIGWSSNPPPSNPDDIAYFILQDQGGYQYRFASPEKTTLTMEPNILEHGPMNFEYNSAWYLTKITHPYYYPKDSISLQYLNIPGAQDIVLDAENMLSYSYTSSCSGCPPGQNPPCVQQNSCTGSTSSSQINTNTIAQRRIISSIRYYKNGTLRQELVFLSSLNSAPQSQSNYKIDIIRLFDYKSSASNTYWQKYFALNYSTTSNRLLLTNVQEYGRGTA